MKFKENLKRFCTLNRHHDAGFTLVELIVVIAILAILAGVAVPAYSGYISQANKSNDESLASEIETALLLGFYNGDVVDGASVVVYTDKAVEVAADTGAHEAMVAAFGENYADLRLSFDGWKANAVVDTSMLTHVDNSGFNEDNLDDLLGSVQHLVDEVAGVINGGTIAISDEAWVEYMEANGIDTTDGRTAANATTMFVATNVADYASSAEKKAEFWDMWVDNNFSFPSTETRFSVEACKYARAMGLATYIDQQTASSADPSSYAPALKLASGVQVIAHMNAMIADMADKYPNEFMAYFGTSEENNYEASTSSRAYSDCMAFLTYMSGLESATDSLKADTDLSSENYYDDGNISNYITSFIDTARLIGGQDGALAFYFVNGKVLCNPLDY